MLYKKIITFVFVMCAVMSLSAQEFHLGIKGGLNFGSASGPNFEDKRRMGWQGGGFAFYNFNRHIGLQVEALYGTRRVITNDFSLVTGNGINTGRKVLHYFTIPMLLKLNAGRFISLVGGPELNILRNKNKYTLNDGTAAFSSKAVFSLSAGIELGYFYCKYVWGPNDFTNLPTADDSKLKQIQFGLKFRII